MQYDPVTSTEHMNGLHSYSYPDQFDTYSGSDFIRYVALAWYRTTEEKADSLPSHDISFPSPSLQTDGRHSLSSGYEESFPEALGHSDIGARLPASPEVPSIEKGNKLLCFQQPVSNYALLDYSSRQVSMSMSAQLHGMFFLAESSRPGLVDGFSQPAELTCYRRNLFQITGSVATPRMMQYILTERGERVPIVAQELVISARESVEGSPVKIISVPWKTPASSTAPSPEEKTEKEPAPIPLDMASNHDMDTEYAIVPFAWKRLQFRVATANNGRRKELQQHFTIKLSILATLQNGNKVPICEILSGPIIVRGRSPRNFQQRKDVPLSCSGGSMRKALNSPPLHRMASSDSNHHSLHANADKSSEHGIPVTDAYHHDQASVGSYEWRGTPVCSEGTLSTASPSDLPMSIPLSPYAQSNPEISYRRKHSLKRKPSTSASPVSVSRSMPQTISSTPERPKKLLRTRTLNTISSTSPFVPGSDPNSSFNLAPSLSTPAFHPSMVPRTGHADSNEFIQYPYLSLGLEDWLPPAHGVYPQHMVQAGIAPPMTAVGGAALGGRDRRYLNEH